VGVINIIGLPSRRSKYLIESLVPRKECEINKNVISLKPGYVSDSGLASNQARFVSVHPLYNVISQIKIYPNKKAMIL
jgi:hypothetical protein